MLENLLLPLSEPESAAGGMKDSVLKKRKKEKTENEYRFDSFNYI